ncbi:MAG: SDR family oxidoreductase [Pseudorhodoplanes sp.]|nr:SDR family oxidoreductase [Pseudorhodoplanes sp.]
MARLAGRSAIVTGGARGIGAYYSRALAAAGARVMIADIADGTALAAQIEAACGAGTAASAICDVSDEAQVMRLVAGTVERFGGIDILVNNAALYASLPPVKCTEIDVALWDRVMAVNVRGPFLMAKHVAPHMIARKAGKIVNIASGTAYKGLPDFLHYVTSKGAIVSFTRALSRDLGGHNICVNTLAPGLILSDTGLENTAHLDQSRSPVIASRAIKRDGYPADLLGALIFLASSDSDFVTGQTIAVDGGSVNT